MTGEELEVSKMPEYPADILAAIESGAALTREQLIRLISLEAGELRLTLTQAVQYARENNLPRTPLGADIGLLVALVGEQASGRGPVT